MRRLLLGAAAVGTALFLVGLVWALSAGGDDAGTRLAPTGLGAAIVIASAGATLAVSVIGIAVAFAPTLRALRKARRLGSETWVVQRGRGLGNALQEINPGRWVDTPSYLVASVSASGFVLSTHDGEVARVPAQWVERVSTASTLTSRRVPSIETYANLPSGASVTVGLVPSRPGFELFPILDVGQTAAIAARWGSIIGLSP
ncbi:MAG TPA: hypothetical protein VL294_09125 [Pseudolysinimonas sp.]|jgi:hypothetical protein|nr:hypothetical protein [Pseudolysinimonas sp.]